MQHEHVLKKYNFDRLNPRVGEGGEKGDCGQNIGSHVDALEIPFYLIFNRVGGVNVYAT